MTTECKNGICTTKLAVRLGGAYSIGAERQSDELAKHVKDSGTDAQYLGYGYDLAIKQVDEGNRTVLFVASSAATDRYGDIIEQEGWQLDFYNRNPIGLWAHDSRALPVAKSNKTTITGGKLTALLQYATADVYPFADTVFKMVKGGFLGAVSVGFIPLEYTFQEAEVGTWPGKIYTKCELLEISTVGVPANPEALVVGRDFANALRSVSILREARDYHETSDVMNLFFSVDEAEGVDLNWGNLDPSVRSTDSNNPSEHSVFTSARSVFACVSHFPDGQSRARLLPKEKNIREAIEASKKSFSIHPESTIATVGKLVGFDSNSRPVFQTKWKIEKQNGAANMCDGKEKKDAAALIVERSVVPFKKEKLADPGAKWSAPTAMGSTDKPADWKRMSTLVEGDATLKGSYYLPHHLGPGGDYATVKRGVSAALARVNQVKAASAADKAGAKSHLMKHMAEFNKKNFSAIERTLEFLFKIQEQVAGLLMAPLYIERAIERYAMDPEASVDISDMAKDFCVAKNFASSHTALIILVKAVKAADDQSDADKLDRARTAVHRAKASMKDLVEQQGALADATEKVEDLCAMDEPGDDDVEEAYGAVASVHKAVHEHSWRVKSYLKEAKECMKGVPADDDDSDDDDSQDYEQGDDQDPDNDEPVEDAFNKLIGEIPTKAAEDASNTTDADLSEFLPQ